ncbi:MAG: glycosyltransferase [Arcobacter sp.]|uniref:glycosyltransferase n=1 Tax=uncultured Arcobacter sp. TaxID=165434 RepID=UPI000CC1A375|nr:glycosyltransferase [uncultured Arcobacter sp.]PLY10466.1 MAG: glycosyltransferase [Arcobacter sp.]
MKKVTFFINSLAGGGAERILCTIINDLHTNFDITLVLMEKVIEYKIPDDIKIIYLSDKKHSLTGISKFINLLLFAYKFAKVSNEIHSDITFSLTTRPNLINILSKLFFKKSKSIIYEVATPSVQYQENCFSSFIVKKMIMHIYPKSDLVLANSYGVANDLSVNFLNQLPVQTIYSPIDIDYIVQSSQEEISFLQKNENLKFITVGRLDEGKNHEMMIKAFSQIKNKKSTLYILGEGVLKSKLKDLVSLLNLQNRVVFLGFDYNPFKYLKQCDIFLFSSNYEGFPTVLIEALSCELPIVSSDCNSGPREILTEKKECIQISNKIDIAEYGILTPINNISLFQKAIDTLISDKTLYDKYKTAALKRARQFSKEQSIQRLNKILEDIRV